MSMSIAPPPYQDALVYPPSKGPDGLLSYLITPVWQQNFVAQQQRINQTPYQFSEGVDLTDQAAAIGITPIPLPSLESGIYRVNIYARITQAATTNSSLTVTLTFTDGSATASQSTDAQTGNTTGSVISAVYPVQIDQATPISYSTAYSSTGATVMQYALRILVEVMPN